MTANRPAPDIDENDREPETGDRREFRPASGGSQSRLRALFPSRFFPAARCCDRQRKPRRSAFRLFSKQATRTTARRRDENACGAGGLRPPPSKIRNLGPFFRGGTQAFKKAKPGVSGIEATCNLPVCQIGQKRWICGLMKEPQEAVFEPEQTYRNRSEIESQTI